MKAKHLLEIGADKGAHTRLLLQYCDAFDANLIVIEPAVDAVPARNGQYLYPGSVIGREES